MKAKRERAWSPDENENFETAKEGSVRVKIYRRERATGDDSKRYVYEVADYSTGKRRLRSFSSHNKAWATAEKIARLIANGETTAAQMRNVDAASFGRAIEILRPTGDSIELAATRYAEAVKILGDGSRLTEAAKEFVKRANLPDKTVSKVIDEMMLEKKSKREDRTLDDLQNRLDKFAESFGASPIASVTKSEIQQWLDKRDTSERDKLNMRSKINTLFRWSWRRDYILENPVEKTEKPDAENGKVEIYSPEEIIRLIDSARTHVKDYLPSLLIGAFAGLRSSEIERLTWADINLARGFITASAKKVGTPSRRIVPIQPNLASWLADYAKKKGRVWKGTHDGFSDAQQDVASHTAIAEDKEKNIEAQEPVKWKHNGLRHSFISYRLAVLQDDGKTALEAGNSKQMIHRHYRELCTPDDAAKWFAIAPNVPANVTTLPKAATA